MPPLPPDEAARVELVKGPNISALPELDAAARPARRAGAAGDGRRRLHRRDLPRRGQGPALPLQHPQARRVHLHPRRRNLPGAGPRRRPARGRRRAATTGRAPPASTPPSPRATWACALVIAQSYARIHWQNLANFGVLPLEFTDPDDLDQIRPGDVLHLADLHAALPDTRELAVESGDRTIQVRHRLSPRQVDDADRRRAHRPTRPGRVLRHAGPGSGFSSCGKGRPWASPGAPGSRPGGCPTSAAVRARTPIARERRLGCDRAPRLGCGTGAGGRARARHRVSLCAGC